MEKTKNEESVAEETTNTNESEAPKLSDSDLEQVAGGTSVTDQEKSAGLLVNKEGLLDLGIGKKNFFKL